MCVAGLVMQTYKKISKPVYMEETGIQLVSICFLLFFCIFD